MNVPDSQHQAPPTDDLNPQLCKAQAPQIALTD